VWNDVEPELIGPYDSKNGRDRDAKQLRAFHGDNHGIYALDMVDGAPGVFSWSASFFMDER
jgi:hypothetical protein